MLQSCCRSFTKDLRDEVESLIKTMTAEEFVAKARDVHGSEYNYDRVEYVNAHTKVIITCKRHGDFQQAPTSHLSGCGCPKCGREKFKLTMLARHGVEYALQRPDVSQKARQGIVNAFGTVRPPNSGRKPLGRDEFIKRARRTHGGKYDYNLVDYVNSTTKVKIICPAHGMFEQTPANHLRGSECPKCRRSGAKADAVSDAAGPSLRDRLFEVFGGPDCVTELFVGCWFIPSRDLHVCESAAAAQVLLNMMGDAMLNCVVLCDAQGRDADLWFAIDCPDGTDLSQRFSWLLELVIVSHERLLLKLSSSYAISRVAKSYQFDVFYHRELALWRENPEYRGLPLRAFLYHNRLKYLGKTPAELSLSELMRSFTISGVLKSFTVFDTEMLSRVLDKYRIKSVYDPCAGWGERMLCCFQHGVKYRGVDVNEVLIPGYEQLRQDYGMAEQLFVYGDSSVILPDGHYDAVVACPPYGSLEIYSGVGAENLSPSNFEAWWAQVVSKCLAAKPRYFCIQTNQKCRDVFFAPVLAAGYVLIDELTYKQKRVSHFNRNKNTKREFESMLVFQIL